jgi:alkylation response protein AidB-like acyl-CoA dehydrogenase
MRGTGSQDFVVDDIFVPSSHTCFLGEAPLQAGPLYNPRMVLTMAFTPVVANALGIARGAIDTFVEMAGRESSTAWFKICRFWVTGRAETIGLRGPDFGWKIVLFGRRRASPGQARWG